MKHITFRRWFPGQPKQDESATFQIETNDDKMNLVEFIVNESDRYMKHFICGEMIATTIFNVPNPGGSSIFQLKDALHLLQSEYDNEDHEEKSMIFYISTDTEKLAFAEWVIEEKFGDFCHDNTIIVIGDLHVPVIGQPLMVPIAEQVSSPAVAPEPVHQSDIRAFLY